MPRPGPGNSRYLPNSEGFPAVSGARLLISPRNAPSRSIIKRETTMEYLHTMVRVSDLDRSLDFFCNKFGLVETRRIENEKGRYTLVFLAADQDIEKAQDTKAPLL